MTISDRSPQSGPSQNEPSEILLICLPWATLEQPNLALGLIKSLLHRKGIASDIRYLNLEFADFIGMPLYRSLKNRNVMAAEWIFSEALFGAFHRPETFLYFLSRLGHTEMELRQWGRIQSMAGPFIDRCMEAIDWQRYKVIGFTNSMMQSTASLALAKRVKAKFPNCRIVFGGSTCEGAMGKALIEAFYFIDVVVRRECDAFVDDLFSRLLRGDSLAGLPVCRRENGEIVIEEMPPPFTDLDSNPTPDYADYFDQVQKTRFHKDIRINLLFESSRGCWYGEHRRCKFCAVNGSSMRYRAKSADVLVNELVELSDRHGIRWFGASDNIFLKHERDRFCQEVIRRLPGAKFHFGVKSNISRKQMSLMKQAGIDEIEPGIEAFSDRLLGLMQKGVSGIRNVYLLRLCAETMVWPQWNYLFGIPGERFEDHVVILNKISPALYHLPAPSNAVGISVMRFNEYFDFPQANGIALKGPLPHYDFIYDLSQEFKGQLAYYFDYRHLNGYDPAAVGRLVEKIVSEWNQAYYRQEVGLYCWIEGSQVRISDTRFGGERLFQLNGSASALYRLLDTPVSVEAVAAGLRRQRPHIYLAGGGSPGILKILRWFEQYDLVYHAKGRYVALGVPAQKEGFWNLRPQKLSPIEIPGRPRPSRLHWKTDDFYNHAGTS